jgi:hypothetical protein
VITVDSGNNSQEREVPKSAQGKFAISRMGSKMVGVKDPHETPNLDLESRIRTGQFPTPRFGRGIIGNFA